jgi:hypothetical protein
VKDFEVKIGMEGWCGGEKRLEIVLERGWMKIYGDSDGEINGNRF